jgi:SAM-dependent methyltransferase
MNKFIQILFQIRSSITRFIRPSKNYYYFKPQKGPLSRKFGFDRGTPIDRYWVESFVNKNKSSIRGICLEIEDSRYTDKYGSNISQSDILDINQLNKKANIYGDLRNLITIIESNTYDCIILTQVLGMIDDYNAAISECFRILKPNGKIIATVSAFSPVYKNNLSFWRFAPLGAQYLFSKYFGKQNVTVTTFGNAYTGQCSWLGMSQEEIDRNELSKNDPEFPCLIGIIAMKVA